MFYVYILQSQVDHTFYIGYTFDIQKRLYEHNSGLTRYSKKKIPWKIVYFELFNNKSDALKRERFLKKQKNKGFYLKLINSHDNQNS